MQRWRNNLGQNDSSLINKKFFHTRTHISGMGGA